MKEILLSVGIDLGTTTTQLVFSKLLVENVASAFSVPRIKIIEKEVFYQSDIYFTPLVSPQIIDINKIKEIIEGEYKKAKLKPDDLSVGAVIITGDTARKENSQLVLESLSFLAGDFVVATAGSDLEAILAGHGSGASQISKEKHLSLANLDVGGGTTNIAVFKQGQVMATSCLDIGGRQITVDKQTNKITYIAPKIKVLISDLALNLKENQQASLVDLEKIADYLAKIIGESLGLEEESSYLDLFTTSKALNFTETLNGCSFSGGVGACFYDLNQYQDNFIYGDIGILLAKAINRADFLKKIKVFKPQETIRATVIGAGSYSVEISGSTICYTDESIFPLKNIPIVKLLKEDESNDYQEMAAKISEKISWYKDETGYQLIALSFKAQHDPSFETIKKISAEIILGTHEYLKNIKTLILITEADMAKSLGNFLANSLGDSIKIISLDSIKVESGDYIDLGKPVAGGRVIPVVIKTLIFGK